MKNKDKKYLIVLSIIYIEALNQKNIMQFKSIDFSFLFNTILYFKYYKNSSFALVLT
jgi:hypothetical protein